MRSRPSLSAPSPMPTMRNENASPTPGRETWMSTSRASTPKTAAPTLRAKAVTRMYRARHPKGHGEGKQEGPPVRCYDAPSDPLGAADASTHPPGRPPPRGRPVRPQGRARRRRRPGRGRATGQVPDREGAGRRRLGAVGPREGPEGPDEPRDPRAAQRPPRGDAGRETGHRPRAGPAPGRDEGPRGPPRPRRRQGGPGPPEGGGAEDHRERRRAGAGRLAREDDRRRPRAVPQDGDGPHPVGSQHHRQGEGEVGDARVLEVRGPRPAGRGRAGPRVDRRGAGGEADAPRTRGRADRAGPERGVPPPAPQPRRGRRRAAPRAGGGRPGRPRGLVAPPRRDAGAAREGLRRREGRGPAEARGRRRRGNDEVARPPHRVLLAR